MEIACFVDAASDAANGRLVGRRFLQNNDYRPAHYYEQLISRLGAQGLARFSGDHYLVLLREGSLRHRFTFYQKVKVKKRPPANPAHLTRKCLATGAPGSISVTIRT
jgi:hypothetical protein